MMLFFWGGGQVALASLRTRQSSACTTTSFMTLHMSDNRKTTEMSYRFRIPRDLLLTNTLPNAYLAQAINLVFFLLYFGASTNQTDQTNAIKCWFLSSSRNYKPGEAIYLSSCWRYCNLDHGSIFTHTRNEKAPTDNNEVIASPLQGLVENYSLHDIFTIDVTTNIKIT